MLNVKKNDKVLEIGTGSGYQTAILVFLGAKVFTIERQHHLYRKVLKKLPKLGYSPEQIKYSDGYLGMKETSPFDKILITAGAIEIPKSLLLQLKIGGEMIIPVRKVIQKMTKGEQVDFETSGLSKREWNELMTSFDFKEKIV